MVVTISISRDDQLCHVCSFVGVKDEAHFVMDEVMECPVNIFIRDNVPVLFKNVVLGGLKSFFRLDHQVDINLYLTQSTALCHSRKLGFLTTS